MQGPQLLLTQASAQVALVGDIEAFVLFPNGLKQRLPSWRSATLEAGQTLLCTKVNSGLAYLAGIAAVRKREAGGRKTTVPTSTRRTISSSSPW